jgi:glutamate/tyrosine decarboxylase-like PLP-dependent enzyme
MKSAIALGVGLDNVICIKTDERGLMCTTHLEHEIQEALQSGAAPFMVNATAGTTVYGAFDPLVKISEICAKYSLWFHIDGSWGGAAVFSDEVRHLMQGITFDIHWKL